MELNRREFMAIPGVAGAGSLLSEEAGLPWHQTIRRVGQLNMTEHDPAVMNVEEWANYWAGLKVDAVLVSVTGILAFYPTRVPFHRRAKFLGDRDFFGECCAAAKKRGLRVIARMSPDLNWKDALDAHPEWFERDAQGNPRTTADDPRLYRTCMFTTYFTDYIPAIMREVNQRYEIDGIFTNGWPPFGQLPDCHCDQCKTLPAAGTPAYWDRFNDRTIYLWKLYDGIAKEKSRENLFFANMGGSIHASPNLHQLAEVCYWFNCDNQGRGGEPSPIWGCALQGRVAYAVMKGRTATNVTGAWCTGEPRWRNVAKSEPEARMWLDQTVASGMVPWYHFIGAEDGLGADRRWQQPGHDFYNWLARNNEHFVNRRSIANLGVVMGQRTQLFYKPPGKASGSGYMQGLYDTLVEGRFPFDFVHEDDLGPETLRKYRALLLPNIALLSDAQCAQLSDYVHSGGSLLATFETSLYNERNQRRDNFGLAGLFGIECTGGPLTKHGDGNPYLARIVRPHEILAGFSNTDWIPGAEFRIPIASVSNPVLTVVPPYPAYPPELSYPPVPKTNDPGIVVKELGASRLIYLPGDVCRTAWISGNTDLGRLLQNCVRWVLKDDMPVRVEGEGILESFAWETKPGFAVHLLNYTNPNLHKGYIRAFYPIGAQRVQLTIPAATSITAVKLLRAGQTVPFRQHGNLIEFTVPKILDYEVAALLRAT
jgi:hypothetical protein